MSDKHTTLPWYAESTSVAEMYEIKYDGRSLATAFSNPYIPSNAKQDAEFIVTACNNHEALVELLKIAKCPNNCHDGAIITETVRTTHGCCGHFNADGSCCGNAIPVPEYDADMEPCQFCYERQQLLEQIGD